MALPRARQQKSELTESPPHSEKPAGLESSPRAPHRELPARALVRSDRPGQKDIQERAGDRSMPRDRSSGANFCRAEGTLQRPVRLVVFERIFRGEDRYKAHTTCIPHLRFDSQETVVLELQLQPANSSQMRPGFGPKVVLAVSRTQLRPLTTSSRSVK